MEKKFADAVSVKNCTHLVVASNEKWAVPAEISDRRFFVLDVSNSRKNDHQYFESFAAEMQSGGPCGLLSFLQQRDISAFKASCFPSTPARLNQKIMSLDTVERWLYEVIDIGYIEGESSSTDYVWPEVLEKRTVYEFFCNWIVRRGLKTTAPSIAIFTSTLKRYGISPCRMSALKGKKRPYGYRFPHLDIVKSNFEEVLGGDIWMEDTANAA